MAIRKRKPSSPGRRFQTSADFSEITRTEPERSLLAKQSGTGGRNNYGRKTARHKGGGHTQRYRVVDFVRNKDGVPATVASVEYDPNRTCRIALLHYHDGEKRYFLAPRDVAVGDVMRSGPDAVIRPGDALPHRPRALADLRHAIAQPVAKPLGRRAVRTAGKAAGEREQQRRQGGAAATGAARAGAHLSRGARGMICHLILPIAARRTAASRP